MFSLFSLLLYVFIDVRLSHLNKDNLLTYLLMMKMPSGVRPSVCPLIPISRDAISLYLVERFLLNLAHMFNI